MISRMIRAEFSRDFRLVEQTVERVRGDREGLETPSGREQLSRYIRPVIWAGIAAIHHRHGEHAIGKLDDIAAERTALHLGPPCTPADNRSYVLAECMFCDNLPFCRAVGIAGPAPLGTVSQLDAFALGISQPINVQER